MTEFSDDHVVKLIDEGLPPEPADYWDRIDESVRSIEEAAVLQHGSIEFAPAEATDKAATSRPWWPSGSALLAAAAVLAVIGLTALFLKPNDKTTTPVVSVPEPTVIDEAPTVLPGEPKLVPTEDSPTVTTSDDTGISQPADIVDTLPVRNLVGALPPILEGAIQDIDDKTVLLQMYRASGQDQSAMPTLGSPVEGLCGAALDGAAPIASLSTRSGYVEGEDIVSTSVTSFASSTSAELAFGEIQSDPLKCDDDASEVVAVAAVDELFGPGIDVDGIVVDLDLSWTSSRTVYLIHERFIGEITYLTAEEGQFAAPETRMKEDVEALSSLLLAPIDVARSGASDVAVSGELDIVDFSTNAQWLARCEADGGIRLTYSTAETAQLLAFEADLQRGVYDADTPAPELLRQQQAASITVDEGLGLVSQQLVPAQAGAYLHIYLPPDGAGFPSVQLFWSGDKNVEEGMSRQEFDHTQFSTADGRGISVAGSPCASGADVVEFSIVAQLDLVTRSSSQVLVYAEDIVAPFMDR